ncbi:MAG: tRNA (N6-isopentenyl adenosine(37)-C2)-methylthiotransferase MiaB, partial [Actinobacteria bacterium]|nr:tRNA (N6-isopentenyl adenosine(37)-C2)-methylthiotransferase MiaB [Actinomycetota bacterium]
MPPKPYFTKTFGCRMNEHDSERIEGLLEESGCANVRDPQGAGLVIFNTCAIRQNADDRLYGHLGHAKALKD